MITLESRAAWLRHRGKYIGGSDAAAVLGLNPWKSNVELFNEKTGITVPEDISDNPNVKFGTEAEPLIRGLFALTYPGYEVHYAENNSWLNDSYPWAAVSHDGWITDKATGRKGIWECKTSEIVSSMSKEKWKDKIPDNYYCQILHSFMIREDCDFAHLTALLTFKYGDKEPQQQIRHYHIERSEVAEDIDVLVKAEAEFAELIKRNQAPALKLPNI